MRLPNIDYTEFSKVGKFNDTLKLLNTEFNLNLEATANARWKPGSYDIIKDKILYLTHPFMHGKKTIKCINYSIHMVGM